MLFWYKALKNNKPITGKIEANDQREVIAHLKSNNFFPIEIKKVDTSQTSFGGLLDRISVSDISYMTRQLAIMINAGLTLVDAVEIIKRQVRKPKLRTILEEVDGDLKEGRSLSESLSKHSPFSKLYVSLVKSGEASGKLNLILQKLAENLEKEKEFQQKVKNALIYPGVVMSAMVIMMFIMVTFVMPQLLDLYKNFDVELPLPTRVLLAVSGFSNKFWPLIIAAVIGGIFAFRNIIKTPPGRLAYDSFMLKIPVLGNIVTISALVNTTRTLSILISSGVSILDTLEIIVEASENKVYELAFVDVRKKVEKGITLGNAMLAHEVFPSSLVQMTIVGEQTGHLDETMAKVSEFYEIESEMSVKTMVTLIEPAILVFLGIGVAFLILAVILPIYSLSNSFQ